MEIKAGVLPNDAINKAYDDMLEVEETKVKFDTKTWSEVFGGTTECPMCLSDYEDHGGCSCHIVAPCGFCCRETQCSHTIKEVQEEGYILPENYNDYLKGAI